MAEGTSQAVHVSASIMCGDIGSLAGEVKKLQDAGADSIHIDVMDGHFVPNLTFGPGAVKAIRRATDLALHVHMMVSNPGVLVQDFATSGADVYFFHLESEPYPLRLARAITQAGMTPGIALNPLTPVAALHGLRVPYVLIMAVEPGFAGQQWIPHTVDRLKEARAVVGPETQIAVDGNVTLDNAAQARANGASIFVCGTSSLFTGAEFSVAIGDIRERLATAELPHGG